MAPAGEVTLRRGRPGMGGATVGACGGIWFGDVRRRERARALDGLKDINLLKVVAY